MTALDVVLRLLKTGDEIVAGTDIYGGTNRLLKFLENQGIKTKHVDVSVVEEVKKALTPATRVVLIETPTNPMIRIIDIRGVVAAVRAECENGTPSPPLPLFSPCRPATNSRLCVCVCVFSSSSVS